MSKKLGFALSGLMLAMVAGTASADMDGGQLNISGLVVDNTCETRVDGGNKDGLILLQTATVGEIDAGVLNDTVGAKAKPFSITVDCSKANPNPGSTAKMTFGSVFFGNSKGTLNNDMSINNPSDGVNIALHNIDGSTIKQVQINNPGDVYTKALDATTKSAVYDFKASYVRAVADQTHNIDGSTIKQVQINNPGDVYTKALDATTKSAVYDFKASYVRAVADQTATAGYVKTNTAYTITYQ